MDASVTPIVNAGAGKGYYESKKSLAGCIPGFPRLFATSPAAARARVPADEATTGRAYVGTFLTSHASIAAGRAMARKTRSTSPIGGDQVRDLEMADEAEQVAAVRAVQGGEARVVSEGRLVPVEVGLDQHQRQDAHRRGAAQSRLGAPRVRGLFDGRPHTDRFGWRRLARPDRAVQVSAKHVPSSEM